VSGRRDHAAVRIERCLAGFDRLSGGAAGDFGLLQGGHRVLIRDRDLRDESGRGAMKRRDLGEAGQARRLEAVIGQGGTVRADVVFNEHEAVHQARALAGNVVQALAVLAPGRVLLIR